MAQDPKDNIYFDDDGSVDIRADGKLKIAGTAITSTAAELNALDGVLATVAELNRAADTSTRVVTETGTALTVTEALHDKKVIVMAETGGDAAATYTLPAATGSGTALKFVVGVVNTSNYVIQVVGDDTMDGHIVSLQDAANTLVGWETAADSDTITLNGTTTGGVAIGDYVELIDIAADQWAVNGITTSSGTEATPFSAAV